MRTLANLVGVGVDYDSNTNTAILTSNKSSEESMSENKNNQIKFGKYIISYDVNYPTEESKQNATIYYDDLALTLYENNVFNLYFGEGYDIKGKYILTNDILSCKSEKISMYNHGEEGDSIYDFATEFEFKILDVDNIRLEKIINTDYTYGSFIDTINVPGNIYTYNEKETKAESFRNNINSTIQQ